MKMKPKVHFVKRWHGHSEALRKQYKKVRRNNDVAAIEEGEIECETPMTTRTPSPTSARR